MRIRSTLGAEQLFGEKSKVFRSWLFSKACGVRRARKLLKILKKKKYSLYPILKSEQNGIKIFN
jgi:hypothetical protein